MKKNIINYWAIFQAGLPVLIKIWAAVLITILALRVTTTEIILIDSSLAKILLGLIFTLLTPLIQYWFNNRNKDKSKEADK